MTTPDRDDVNESTWRTLEGEHWVISTYEHGYQTSLVVCSPHAVSSGPILQSGDARCSV